MNNAAVDINAVEIPVDILSLSSSDHIHTVELLNHIFLGFFDKSLDHLYIIYIANIYLF